MSHPESSGGYTGIESSGGRQLHWQCIGNDSEREIAKIARVRSRCSHGQEKQGGGHFRVSPNRSSNR